MFFLTKQLEGDELQMNSLMQIPLIFFIIELRWSEFEFKSEVESRISQSHYIHKIFPWLCKKGDYWVVWILNGQVYNISTALIPSSSKESIIHYGDLNWDSCHTRQG